MFCPKCKYEYREAFSECSDCKIPLIERLPSEENLKEIQFKQVTSVFRQDEVSTIKSILDARNITYVIHSEAFGTMYRVSGTNRLMVQEDEYESVMELLKDLL